VCYNLERRSFICLFERVLKGTEKCLDRDGELDGKYTFCKSDNHFFAFANALYSTIYHSCECYGCERTITSIIVIFVVLIFFLSSCGQDDSVSMTSRLQTGDTAVGITDHYAPYNPDLDLTGLRFDDSCVK